MANKGRPKQDSYAVPFSAHRFNEVLKARKLKLYMLNEDEIVCASEKTIRRAKKSGFINPELLDRLGQRLNINPDYISGKYDLDCEALANGDSTKEKEYKSLIRIEEHPYIERQYLDIDVWNIIHNILLYKNVPIEQLNSMSKEQLVLFYIDFSKTIRHLVERHFKPVNYSTNEEYTIPMPPEKDIPSSDLSQTH